MLLEPGSFVELRRATTCINAILLSSSYASRMLIYSSLSNTGEVFVHQQDDVYFDAPGFVAKDVIARCGGGEGEDVPDIAENKTQLQARVEVLKKLREVQREVENATNVLLSRQGTESLDVYALTSEERNWGETTVWEVAKLLGPLNRNHTGQLNSSDPSLSSTDTTDTNLPASASSSSPIRTPSFYQILAAHKYLLANPLYFVPAHDYGTSRRVRVRPREDVRRMTEIDGWVRERGRIREGEEEENPNPLERFIEKARLVTENQKLKKGEGVNMLHSPPTRDTSKAGSALTWTTSDQSIITFLVQSLRTLNRAQADAFLIGVQYIVKKVYRDVDDVTDEVVHRLLIEIGAFPPWQDLTEIKAIVEQELYLDTTGDKENGFSRKQEEVLDQVQHSESLPYQPQPNGPLGPDDFYPSDLAASFRHDFEEMPVYVIDDTDAKELDDGISVEAVEQNPDQVWIHVHIADPTSLLPPTHALAKEAEKMTESMYLVHRSYPMLPRGFTHHPTLGFSLGCTTTATSGQPTLTFSARISLDNAEILEYKVRAGMVKNLIICSYDEVDRALGFGNRIWNRPFSLADVSSPSTPSSGTLENPQHKTNLTLLYKATQSLVRKRVEDGVFIQSRPVSKLAGIRWPSTSDSGIVGFPIKPEQPVYEYTGYPFFASFSQANSNTPSQSDLLSYLNQYATTAQHTLDGHSHSLVAECMKLASRACSMFCRDRDVPILRRWAGPPLISGEQGLADLLNARNKDGYLVWGSENDNNTASPNGWKLAGAHILGDSAAGYTLDLRAHWGLGIPEAEGYVRCTSPLRRYADLVVHWQIKSVLIDEENNKRAGLPATKPKYLYPTSYLSSFATSNKAAERFRRRIAGQHEAWWSIAWLIRWAEAYQSWTSGEGLGAWYEFTPTAMTASTRPNLSESSSRNLQGLPNPFADLTATLSARPEANRDSKKWQAAVTLTGLGIKAVLIEGGGSGGGYHISELSVGDTVPVRVNAMRLGVRPQVQVVPRTD
ncbi:hypothetical protein EV361DRAFT_435266 [Lentinula raphanica]|nr:hypothetical protein EV361DRAFT_435266 [Lentinula raphanica]